MSSVLLERFVFSKPYFDRLGLIVAIDDDGPAGFVHAGFGPTDDSSSLSTHRGVTCMLMVMPRADRAEVAAELLRRSEAYLQEHGVVELFAGGLQRLGPFYLGLYGGSQQPGVLASDAVALQWYRAAGYEEVGRRAILQLRLATFRPIVNRQQMQLRRRYQIQAELDPKPANWWEACTEGQTERTRYVLDDRQAGTSAGAAMLWDMEPLASNWGIHAAGLLSLEISKNRRHQGLATFLLGEAFRHLYSQGTSLIEVHCDAANAAARGLFTKMGFAQIEEGIVLRKALLQANT